LELAPTKYRQQDEQTNLEKESPYYLVLVGSTLGTKITFGTEYTAWKQYEQIDVVKVQQLPTNSIGAIAW
jgi:hypothetical protein